LGRSFLFFDAEKLPGKVGNLFRLGSGNAEWQIMRIVNFFVTPASIVYSLCAGASAQILHSALLLTAPTADCKSCLALKS